MEEAFDVRSQLVRIDRDLAETHKLVAETGKFVAEERKLNRDTSLAPWVIALNVFSVLLAAVVGGLIARVL